MDELQESSVRLIESVTNGKIQAISFDLEIQKDKLKYSGWLTALATAGLALLITNFEDVVPKLPTLGEYAVAGPILSALSFASSLLLGGYLHWTLNKSFDRKRQEMTLFLKQKCILYSGIAIDAGEDLLEKLKSGDYLPSENREYLRELDKDYQNGVSEELILLFQVAMVSLGFVIALLGTMI